MKTLLRYETSMNVSILLIHFLKISLLIHVMAYWSLSILPEKHQKTRGFLMFSGGIDRDQWHKIG